MNDKYNWIVYIVFWIWLVLVVGIVFISLSGCYSPTEPDDADLECVIVIEDGEPVERCFILPEDDT